MITKDELAAMIAALESQPHLSLKEEKYLAVCKALNRRMKPVVLPDGFSVGDNEDDPSYFNTWCYDAAEVKAALDERGVEWI